MTDPDRRRAKRRPILNHFSLFVVIPKKGSHRLQVHDLSEIGIGFDFDIEGEATEQHPLKQGDTIELHFYINSSLYIPLAINITRIEDRQSTRRVGAEFTDQKSKTHQAFLALIKLLDELHDELIKVPPQGPNSSFFGARQ